MDLRHEDAFFDEDEEEDAAVDDIAEEQAAGVPARNSAADYVV